MEVLVESRRDADLTRATRQLTDEIRGNLGIRVTVTVTGPGTVERSAGKMRRVLDERG
jgi:phenylacetate-coenzyme A ligase PaaK-like adenylate-forming protein